MRQRQIAPAGSDSTYSNGALGSTERTVIMYVYEYGHCGWHASVYGRIKMHDCMPVRRDHLYCCIVREVHQHILCDRAVATQRTWSVLNGNGWCDCLAFRPATTNKRYRIDVPRRLQMCMYVCIPTRMSIQRRYNTRYLPHYLHTIQRHTVHNTHCTPPAKHTNFKKKKKKKKKPALFWLRLSPLSRRLSPLSLPRKHLYASLRASTRGASRASGECVSTSHLCGLLRLLSRQQRARIWLHHQPNAIHPCTYT